MSDTAFTRLLAALIVTLLLFATIGLAVAIKNIDQVKSRQPEGHIFCHCPQGAHDR